MAIKTKKITDLDKIAISADENCFLLGMKDEVVGMISYKELCERYEEEMSKLYTEIDTLKAKIDELEAREVPTCTCDTKGLEDDMKKVIDFIEELQKDRYLTLAEIRKAASDAFPIEETILETEE